MKLQTRAVSHFFSDSKAWVAHLVELMDLDAFPTRLPTHSEDPLWKHPVIAWLNYDCDDFFALGEVEVAKMKLYAFEGFQGYRIWFNGLHTWHRLCPQMTLRYLEIIMQLYGATAAQVPRFLLWRLMASGIRQFRLPMAKGLLPALCSEDLERHVYKDALRALNSCRSVFHHLTPNFAAELFESVTSRTDEELWYSGLEKVLHIMVRCWMKETCAV
eukprot:Skav225891  [mRNA]  locus=scaffold1460:162904:163551:- [translate_table: standard]